MKQHSITKALLFIIATALVNIKSYGQTIRHTVNRGETIESIAELYGTTINELSSLNNDIDTFYTGMEIDIPFPDDMSAEEYTRNPERILEYYADYKRLINMYNASYTKDAEEAYKKLIDDYSKVSNCSEAYYELAKYYYNKDKLNKARVTFYIALSDDALSSKKKEKGQAYIAKIEEILQERAERRSQIWNNISTGIVQGLQMGVNAYMQYEQMKQSGTTANSGYNSFTGINSNLNGLDPASEAYTAQALRNADASYNKTINQLQQNSNAFLNQSMVNIQNELQMSRQRDQQCHDLWVRNLGREPTPEEDQAWWTNYSNGMANAYLQANSNTSASSSSGNNASYNTNDAIEKAKEYYDNRYGNKTCHICNGYKKCKYCNGTKIHHNDITGKDEPCEMCWLQNGVRTGLCRQCGGTGQTYGVKN